MSDRTRTVSWSDPSSFLADPAKSGLDLLLSTLGPPVLRPPVGELLDLVPVEFAKGRAVFTLVAREFHYSLLNTMHGGVHAFLLDTAMGCAVMTMMAPGQGYTTTDLQVRYVRPVTVASGTLRGEGTVVHAGSRLVTAEGRITDGAGRLVAHGSTACLTFPR
ncbi:MAG TPA: PaaI family thioesterase [Gemmatimonadaceae bacterium]|nr:PaaI family thioesterase [Gemmatimonadaceae bacterium]